MLAHRLPVERIDTDAEDSLDFWVLLCERRKLFDIQSFRILRSERITENLHFPTSGFARVTSARSLPRTLKLRRVRLDKSSLPKISGVQMLTSFRYKAVGGQKSLGKMPKMVKDPSSVRNEQSRNPKVPPEPALPQAKAHQSNR